MTWNLIQLALALLIIVIPILIIQYKLDVSRIRKDVQAKGWRKARITPIAGNRKSLNDGHKRFYRIDYLNTEDKECFAICKASVLNGISWEAD